MNFIQIQEPGISEKKRIAVGIDFGTTNSLVGYVDQDKPIILSDEHGRKKIPSIVAITKKQETIIGTKAVALKGLDDVVIIKSIKRLIGKEFKDLSDDSPLKKMIKEDMVFNINGISFNVVEICNLILKKIKSIVGEKLGESVADAVITVPAYFDETQRRAVKFAAELAGLRVLRVINEPTAAALAYRLNEISSGTYIVYDFGGGTFDVSILEIYNSIVRVVATGGDMNLGGDDIDLLLAKDLLKRINQDQFNVDSLLDYATQIKERLSVEKNVNIKFGDNILNIDRDYFNELIEPVIARTMSIVSDTLERAEISKSDISGVILVGGSTRINMVPSVISNMFDGVALHNSIDPDEVVAMGASIQANNLVNTSDHLLLDVTPLSLGLELMGGLNEKIIYRNSPIPTSMTKEFTTYEDGQTGLKLHIVQGEAEMVKECRSLARLELLNIPPMKAGAARIEVKFTIDSDGLLTVIAREKSTGIYQSVEVIPTYGLDSSTIEKMLLESRKTDSQEDKSSQIEESKIYAEELLSKISLAISKDKDLLSEEEYNSIHAHLDNLRSIIKSDEKSKIDSVVNQVEESVELFFARRNTRYINIDSKLSSLLN